eukprot:RCo006581
MSFWFINNNRSCIGNDRFWFNGFFHCCWFSNYNDRRRSCFHSNNCFSRCLHSRNSLFCYYSCFWCRHHSSFGLFCCWRCFCCNRCFRRTFSDYFLRQRFSLLLRNYFCRNYCFHSQYFHCLFLNRSRCFRYCLGSRYSLNCFFFCIPFSVITATTCTWLCFRRYCFSFRLSCNNLILDCFITYPYFLAHIAAFTTFFNTLFFTGCILLFFSYCSRYFIARFTFFRRTLRFSWRLFFNVIFAYRRPLSSFRPVLSRTARLTNRSCLSFLFRCCSTSSIFLTVTRGIGGITFTVVIAVISTTWLRTFFNRWFFFCYLSFRRTFKQCTDKAEQT